MDIKLKTGSSVNILNSSGTTICSVAEDGTISGISGGTKLYQHILQVSSDVAMQNIKLITTFSDNIASYEGGFIDLVVIFGNLYGYAAQTNAVNGLIRSANISSGKIYIEYINDIEATIVNFNLTDLNTDTVTEL